MKTTGLKHQMDAILRSRGQPIFGYFFEQGCGKTWAGLADAEWLFEQGLIQGLLVVAPKGVHTNWTRREIPSHMSVPTMCYTWKGKPTSKKAKVQWEAMFNYRLSNPPLRVLSMNVDAFNTPAGREHAEQFLEEFDCVMIVDESTRIKNPKAKRTDNVIKAGRKAKYRRILTGTPITKGPLDLYSQFHFLKAGLLGTKSYRSFVSEFAVLIPADSPKGRAIMERSGSRFMPQVVATDEATGRPIYRNLDKLISMMAPHVHRVRKEDCLDLPAKVRDVVYFELLPDQRKTYDLLRQECEFATDLECHSFEAIAARTKMKQVTSGFINIKGELVFLSSDLNPRYAALNTELDRIEEDDQIIIWAIYQEEIRQIKRLLAERNMTFATYVGETSTADREAAIDDFQNGRIQVFVGNAQAAGIGLTLTAAKHAIYYSCDYDLEKRLQSEDRCHRIGTKHTVRYVDLVAEDTIDEEIMRSLSRKNEIATTIIDSETLLKGES